MTTHQPPAGIVHSEFAERLLRNDPATTDPRFRGDAPTPPTPPSAAPSAVDEGYETTDDDDRFDAG